MHTFANMKHEYGIKVSSAAMQLGAILTQALLAELKNAAALTKKGQLETKVAMLTCGDSHRYLSF